MKIVSITIESKIIQSWNAAFLPVGYAWFPDDIDTAEFYVYNGFVNLTVEDDTVTSYTPNVEAWEEWNDSLEDNAETEEEDNTWDELASALREGVNSI